LRPKIKFGPTLLTRTTTITKSLLGYITCQKRGIYQGKRVWMRSSFPNAQQETKVGKGGKNKM